MCSRCRGSSSASRSLAASSARRYGSLSTYFDGTDSPSILSRPCAYPPVHGRLSIDGEFVPSKYVLSKPYRRAELAAKLRDALDDLVASDKCRPDVAPMR